MKKHCLKTKQECPNDLSEWDGATFAARGGVLIYLSPKSKDPIDTIIHESVHAWQHFVEHICETTPGAEAEAYTIAFVATTLLKEHRAIHEKS